MGITGSAEMLYHMVRSHSLHKSIQGVFKNKCHYISTKQVISFLDLYFFNNIHILQVFKHLLFLLFVLLLHYHILGNHYTLVTGFQSCFFFTFFYSSVLYFFHCSFYSLFILHELLGLLSLLCIAR